MKKTLIIVDMQNDFVYGSLGTGEARSIVPKIQEKLEAYIDRGDDVIFTLDTHGENYLKTNEGKMLPVEHCIKGTPGWDIVKAFQTALEKDASHVFSIEKPSFGYLNWKEKLRFSDEIELVGVCTDICVVSNALILKAAFPESTILVDASCCAGTTPESHKAAVTVMKSCQVKIAGE